MTDHPSFTPKTLSDRWACSPLKSDVVPVHFEDLTLEDRAVIAKMLERLDERKKRAASLHQRLLRLDPSAAAFFHADRLTSDFDEPKLAALEALVALVPTHRERASEGE